MLSEQDQEERKDSFQFAACALILLRDAGGGADVAAASIAAAELRSACLKENFCNWSRPGTAEWAPVLHALELSFARKQDSGATIGIIELAMVVGASRFIHSILAPPPPAASFINFSVQIPPIFSLIFCCVYFLTLCLKFGPVVLINSKQKMHTMKCMHDADNGEGSVYTLLTYAVRVNDISLIKVLLKHGDGMTFVEHAKIFIFDYLTMSFPPFISHSCQRCSCALVPSIQPLLQR
jgi:hypothetical protein